MPSLQEKSEYPYGYGLGKISLAKLYMNKANVGKWSTALFLYPLLAMYFWTLFRENIFKNELYNFVDSFIGSLSFLVWGFLGYFWMYRRQIPQVVTVKGKPAYIMGIFMMIVSCSVSIYLFVFGIQSLVEIVR